MNNKGSGLTPAQALDKLDALYEQSVVALRNAIGNYITSGELPDENARKQGLFVYPSLTVTWDGSTTNPPKTRAFGRFTHAGSYTTTITRPTLFRSYLNEQLTLLYQDYGAHISVQPSQHEIPYPYVIDGSELTLDRSMSAGLTRYFPTTELAQIGDETADGIYHPTEFSPLSHFDARRVDFSLARLRHYTGTPVEHFQPFVLFTNYTRYVDEEEGNIVIYTEPTDLHKGIAALKAAGITEFSTTELEMIAQSEVELSPEDLEIFEGLVDALEDDDDVQKVYHNVANL
ncbi:hypothetical protein FQF57_21895 [Escherichia coli]|nr:hypothetical protein [Escherichia coli]